MKLFEEFKLWEDLWTAQPVIKNKSLNEKWETFDYFGLTKLWHSNSVSEFRAFLGNAANAGIKGLRLSITDGLYLAARASDLTHDGIVEVAKENYITTNDRKSFEWSTCGFPKLSDFDIDNLEGKDIDEEGLAFQAETRSASRAKYDSYKDCPVIDPITCEILWLHDGKPHQLVADCGTFEVALYNFYSEQFPEFKYGDTDNLSGHWHEKRLFEASETYFALKPLIKKLYMTNLDKRRIL